MALRLSRVRIQNFKSIPPAGVRIDFRENSRIVILVGKNNAGKSNILEAISLILGATSVWRASFPRGAFNDFSKPIIIEAEIQDAKFGDGKLAGLSDQQCHSLGYEAKRKESHPGRFIFRLSVPSPTDEEIDDEDDQEPQKRTFELIANQSPIKRRSDEIRRRLVSQMTVPTVRSQSDLLSPSAWTPYGRLLRDLLAESGKSGELVELINQATRRLQDILKDEAAMLTRTAKATSYVDEIGFNLTKEGDPAELLRNLSLAVTYANRTEDISRVGTGTQSAVIIGVLELCLRHGARSGARIFAVEEPEAFLHPQAQRYVAKLLRSISQEPRSHVILTTHSTYIASDSDLLDVIRVDRDDLGYTRCLGSEPN